MERALIDDQHFETRRKSLCQQIDSYRSKIQEYQSLQHQFKAISADVSQKEFNQSQGPSIKKNLSAKNLKKTAETSSFNNGMTPQSAKMKTIKIDQKRHSSVYKVKIYEMKKKLQRINKEYNEKFTEFASLRRQQEVIRSTIVELKESAVNELKQSEQLDLESEELNAERQTVNRKLNQQKAKYQKIFETVTMYQFEKDSVIGKNALLKQRLEKESNLKRMNYPDQNSNIEDEAQSGQATERTQSLEIQEDQSQSKEHCGNSLTDKLDLSYSKITTKEKKLHFQGQQYEIIDSNYESFYKETAKQPFCKPEIQGHQHQIQFSLLQNSRDEQTQMHPSDYQTNLLVLKDNIGRLSSENTVNTEQLFALKSQMNALQALTKHHKVNGLLSESKLTKLQKFIKRERANMKQLINEVEKNQRVASAKQSKAGEFRGKLGTKTQQVALLKGLNGSLLKDLEFLKEKVNHLMVCQGLLHNTMAD